MSSKDFDINELFKTEIESEIKLPSKLRIINSNDAYSNPEYSATSTIARSVNGNYSATSNNNMTGGAPGCGSYSATSNNNINLIGGSYSATSANNDSAKDVDKLLAMLTSESEDHTSTQNLENQLHNILKQEGGNSKIGVNEIRRFFTDLKSQGVNVNVKLNDQTMSEFFNEAQNTTTELASGSVSGSVSGSASNNLFIDPKQNSQQGGKKKNKLNKIEENSEEFDLDGGKGSNPGFQAFLDLKKFIAEKLGVSNGPKAGKVAGAVQREVKEKNPNLSATELCEAGKKHFTEHLE
jgi:hypothetical protein